MEKDYNFPSPKGPDWKETKVIARKGNLSKLIQIERFNTQTFQKVYRYEVTDNSGNLIEKFPGDISHGQALQRHSKMDGDFTRVNVGRGSTQKPVTTYTPPVNESNSGGGEFSDDELNPDIIPDFSKYDSWTATRLVDARLKIVREREDARQKNLDKKIEDYKRAEILQDAETALNEARIKANKVKNL